VSQQQSGRLASLAKCHVNSRLSRRRARRVRPCRQRPSRRGRFCCVRTRTRAGRVYVLPCAGAELRVQSRPAEGPLARSARRGSGNDPADPAARYAQVPPQLLCPHERAWQRFDTTNALVPDPAAALAAEERERPWSPEEKRVFNEKFLAFPKARPLIMAAGRAPAPRGGGGPGGAARGRAGRPPGAAPAAWIEWAAAAWPPGAGGGLCCRRDLPASVLTHW